MKLTEQLQLTIAGETDRNKRNALKRHILLTAISLARSLKKALISEPSMRNIPEAVQTLLLVARDAVAATINRHMYAYYYL